MKFGTDNVLCAGITALLVACSCSAGTSVDPNSDGTQPSVVSNGGAGVPLAAAPGVAPSTPGVPGTPNLPTAGAPPVSGQPPAQPGSPASGGVPTQPVAPGDPGTAPPEPAFTGNGMPVFPPTAGGTSEPVAMRELCALPRPTKPRLRMLSPEEIQATLADIFKTDKEDVDVSQLPAYTLADHSNFPDTAKASVLQNHAEAFLELAKAVSPNAANDNVRYGITNCNQFDNSECRRQFIEGLGYELFRRPLTAEETQRYMDLAADPEIGIASDDDFLTVTAQAMLVSPSFLYRTEVGSGGRLNDFEVASELAFHFLGRGPDEDMLDDAADGKFQDADFLQQTAERLAASDEFKARVVDFAGRWTGASSVLRLNKNNARFPEFNNVKQRLHDEQEAFFEEVFTDDDATAATLLQPGFIFADDDLAQFYGLPANGGQSMQKRAITSAERGGILRMGSIIAAHSTMDEVHPVRIADFIRTTVMCQTLPPVPEGLMIDPVPFDPTKPLRERYAQHSTEPSCAACHQFLDPIGFTYEAYDAIGGQASMANGQPPNTTGTLVGVNGISDGTSVELSNVNDLVETLLTSPSAMACVARQYWRYTFARQETADEACELEHFEAKFLQSGGSLSKLMTDIVTTPSFTSRY